MEKGSKESARKLPKDKDKAKDRGKSRGAERERDLSNKAKAANSRIKKLKDNDSDKDTEEVAINTIDDEEKSEIQKDEKLFTFDPILEYKKSISLGLENLADTNNKPGDISVLQSQVKSEPVASKPVTPAPTPIVISEADICAGEAIDEFWNLAWEICTERFYCGNGGLIISLELRDTWQRMVEINWLDLEPQHGNYDLVHKSMFTPDEAALPMTYDFWSKPVQKTKTKTPLNTPADEHEMEVEVEAREEMQVQEEVNEGVDDGQFIEVLGPKRISSDFEYIMKPKLIRTSSINISEEYKAHGEKPWSPTDCGAHVGRKSGVFTLHGETTAEALAKHKAAVQSEDAKIIKKSVKRRPSERLMYNMDDYDDDDDLKDILHFSELNDFADSRPASLDEDDLKILMPKLRGVDGVESKIELPSVSNLHVHTKHKAHHESVQKREKMPKGSNLSISSNKPSKKRKGKKKVKESKEAEEAKESKSKRSKLKVKTKDKKEKDKKEKDKSKPKIKASKTKSEKSLGKKAKKATKSKSGKSVKSTKSKKSKKKLQRKLPKVKMPECQSDTEILRWRNVLRKHAQFVSNRSEMYNDENQDTTPLDLEISSVLAPVPVK